jgi:hypothetical protein
MLQGDATAEEKSELLPELELLSAAFSSMIL